MNIEHTFILINRIWKVRCMIINAKTLNYYGKFLEICSQNR